MALAWYRQAARRLGEAAASPWAGLLAIGALGAWLVTGAWLGFPETWHAALNAAGWVTALLMLFLLQHEQRRDTRAIHLKLDELLAAAEGASNEAIRAERLEEGELERIRRKGPGPAPGRQRHPATEPSQAGSSLEGSAGDEPAQAPGRARS